MIKKAQNIPTYASFATKSTGLIVNRERLGYHIKIAKRIFNSLSYPKLLNIYEK